MSLAGLFRCGLVAGLSSLEIPLICGCISRNGMYTRLCVLNVHPYIHTYTYTHTQYIHTYILGSTGYTVLDLSFKFDRKMDLGASHMHACNPHPLWGSASARGSISLSSMNTASSISDAATSNAGYSKSRILFPDCRRSTPPLKRDT